MSYVVRPGDNLWTIAQRMWGNGNLYTRFRGFRSGNPSLIYPGEVITWDGDPDTQPKPQAAPQPAAPAGPPAKTAEQVIADQYAAEEQIYNQLIGDVRDYRKGWNNIYTGGDTAYNTKDLTPEEQAAYKNALTDENAEKYKAYLNGLADIQAMRADPYYEQKVQQGLIPDLSTREGMSSALEAIMNKYMVEKTGDNGATWRDSGITGVGTKMMDMLRESAYTNLQDVDLIKEQQARAREVAQNWGQATASASDARNQLSQSIEKTGKRGGVSNRQVADLANSTAGMMQNITGENTDWRNAYITGMNASNQGYANQKKNEDMLATIKSKVMASPITNQDLKTKVNAYAGLT